MKTRMVFVQGKSGEIVWKNIYTDMTEMLHDIEIMEKPSMFGTIEFRIVIQVV